ncbi:MULTISPECIES: ATP-binding protein [Streptomyces]|uniref:AAA+ ATPase domain-containing protein n=2 Tax=Streptomyces TaxID=1883 RepID=A0A2U9PAS6_STRAS|nr:hypothetical protein [Streptomyces actuosus]AWT46677.1 hypothetical protein DMT42_33245 [Streptomyces actuosus]MBM4823405.1 hypothetical protein [Streptomyces actuosus]
MIGRERETAAVAGLLAAHRLVTVTGPPGAGKSTVAAAAVAASVSAGWECLVQVRRQGSAPGRPGDLAADLVTRLTGAPPAGPVAPERAARALPDAPTLLWLDDVDPVHDECVRLVQQVLLRAPRTGVLVTSRRALGLDAERTVRLSGLRCRPAPEDGEGPAPAVELFLRHAPTGHGAPDPESVAEVCRLVEGLPLAVELAAEQTAQLPVRELVRLLRLSQTWLAGPRRAHRRHRSLRDAAGSAWMLCDTAVRTVWARASLFAGSFTETSAVHLCAGGAVEPAQVPSCLVQLAAHGVLEVRGEVGAVREHRYRMTRLAREFGAERLTARGEFAAAALRRSQRWGQVAAEAESLWERGAQSRAVRLVSEEYEELAALFAHACTEPSLAPAALQTGLRLWFWWVACDRAEEGADRLLALLPHCDGSPLLARGQWLAAWLSARTAPETARALLDDAWWASVLAGDTATVGRIAHVQGVLALQEGDARAAAGHFQLAADTIPAHAPGGPPATLSLAALALAQLRYAPAAARRSAHRALAQAGLRQDAWVCQVARYAQACTDHGLGRPGRAWQRARRALADTDDGLPATHGTSALRQLLADIETGSPARLELPAALVPHTAPLPAPRPSDREIRLGRGPAPA